MIQADHLKQLEEHLLDPAVRHNPAMVSVLLADDFIEFGSSGRIFNKSAIMKDLENEPARPASILSDFSVREISPATALVTYKTTRRSLSGKIDSQSWRSSIWMHLDGRWQIVFHQGTLIPVEPE